MENMLKPFSKSLSENSIKITCTISPIAYESFFYIQEAGYLKALEYHNINRESFNSYLFVIVLDGKGELIYDDKSISLNKGNCFFIDCSKPCNYFCPNSAPWEIMWVNFNGATSGKYYNCFNSMYGNVINPKNSSPFIDIIKLAIEINKNSDMVSEINSSKLIMDLLTLLLTFKNSEGNEAAPLKIKLEGVKYHLDKNFKREVYLDSLSEMFLISKFYLTREFKKMYGMTISKYIITRRINYAKRLLRFTNKSIEKISEVCGFYDTSYFCKKFKSEEGITPFKFRKYWREA